MKPMSHNTQYIITEYKTAVSPLGPAQILVAGERLLQILPIFDKSLSKGIDTFNYFVK